MTGYLWVLIVVDEGPEGRLVSSFIGLFSCLLFSFRPRLKRSMCKDVKGA